MAGVLEWVMLNIHWILTIPALLIAIGAGALIAVRYFTLFKNDRRDHQINNRKL